MNDTIRILGIDPGNNIGITIYTLDAMTLEILSIETRTIILDNYVHDDKIDRLLHRMVVLGNAINEILWTYNPSAIAIEEAFLNMRFPNAVMQLSRYIGVVLYNAQMFNPFIKLFKYPPMYVKKYIGAHGVFKDDVTNAVAQYQDITSKISLVGLTEHEIDSIAIGYVAINEIKRYPFLLYMV